MMTMTTPDVELMEALRNNSVLHPHWDSYSEHHDYDQDQQQWTDRLHVVLIKVDNKDDVGLL